MFQLLKEPNIDFMSKRRVLLTLSMFLIVASVVVLLVRGDGNPILGLHPGIEFTGGTEVQLKFSERPDVGAIRDALSQGGMPNSLVTTIGKPEENEVYIRVGTLGDSKEREDQTTRVVAAVEDRFGGHKENLVDLNLTDSALLAQVLDDAPALPDGTSSQLLAAAVLERRKDVAIFHSVQELGSVPGMTPELVSFLEGRTFTGPVAVRSQSYIGPAIGKELLNKALFAIIGSLVGMLIYIWIRFQFQWGFAAVLALAHDTVITLGLFSLFGKEMSLPVVAAFLTLIGYSVNDTVVVFDRIREDLKLRKANMGFETVVNQAINQTLSRTVITSGLTWIVVFGLFMFGGAALNPFAFVLTVGVIVGTYSSIYIASPFLVMWTQFLERRSEPARKAAVEQGRGDQRGKAVRGSSRG